MEDERPSFFLQRLRNQAGTDCNEAILRSLFLEQLPENTCNILVINPQVDLAVLANQADRILDVI